MKLCFFSSTYAINVIYLFINLIKNNKLNNLQLFVIITCTNCCIPCNKDVYNINSQWLILITFIKISVVDVIMILKLKMYFMS